MKKRNLSLPKLSHLRTTNKSNNADVELPTPMTPTTSTTINYYSDNEENHHRKRYSMVSTSSIKEASTANTATAAAASSVHSRNRRKSSSAISVINLLDNDFIELIPIDQVNSSKEAITGSYLAEEPGNYVLIFGR